MEWPSSCFLTPSGGQKKTMPAIPHDIAAYCIGKYLSTSYLFEFRGICTAFDYALSVRVKEEMVKRDERVSKCAPFHRLTAYRYRLGNAPVTSGNASVTSNIFVWIFHRGDYMNLRDITLSASKYRRAHEESMVANEWAIDRAMNTPSESRGEDIINSADREARKKLRRMGVTYITAVISGKGNGAGAVASPITTICDDHVTIRSPYPSTQRIAEYDDMTKKTYLSGYGVRDVTINVSDYHDAIFHSRFGSYEDIYAFIADEIDAYNEEYALIAASRATVGVRVLITYDTSSADMYTPIRVRCIPDNEAKASVNDSIVPKTVRMGVHHYKLSASGYLRVYREKGGWGSVDKLSPTDYIFMIIGDMLYVCAVHAFGYVAVPIDGLVFTDTTAPPLYYFAKSTNFLQIINGCCVLRYNA